MEIKHKNQIQLPQDSVVMTEINTQPFKTHLNASYEATIKIKKDKSQIMLDIDFIGESQLEKNLLTLASHLDLCLTFEIKKEP
jgi:hypothetical protein